MTRYPQRKSGFSLIELLVAISVIVILTTITVKLWANVSQKVAVNATIEKLENVDHWLEEFYAIYGYYPNATDFSWEDPTDGGKPDDWDLILSKAPQLAEYSTSKLLYWMNKFIPESEHKSRFDFYYQKIGPENGNPEYSVDSEDFGFEYGIINYTNVNWNVTDAWGNGLHYRVGPDLQSYKTWSDGPDGVSNTPDDVSNDDFTE
jgi:prepilin-type N-terminal cleavage/methylation domain-containing protein